MKFSIQNVVEDPLIIVWKVMIQGQLHYIRQLKDLVISCRIYKPRSHIIMEISYWAKPGNLSFCENFKTFR